MAEVSGLGWAKAPVAISVEAIRNRLNLFMAITTIQEVPAHKIVHRVELFHLSQRSSADVGQPLPYNG
jgi:hypothetical protein